MGYSSMLEKTYRNLFIRFQGQERFYSMLPMYYRGSNAAILVYDITSEESFESVKHWVRGKTFKNRLLIQLKELNTNVRNDIIIAIAANKSDLINHRKVTPEEAKEYAHSIDAYYFETSAKDDKGIEDLFLTISRKLIEKHISKNVTVTPGATVGGHMPIALDGAKPRKRTCCS